MTGALNFEVLIFNSLSFTVSPFLTLFNQEIYGIKALFELFRILKSI